MLVDRYENASQRVVWRLLHNILKQKRLFVICYILTFFIEKNGVRLLVRARERRAAAGAAVGWDPLVRVRCAATIGGGAEGAREIQRAMPDRRPGCSLVVEERGEADST